MSVPPEMMPPPGAGAPGAGASPGEPPPAAGGMMTPQSPEGKIASGKAQLATIASLATNTLPSFPMGTPEFKCCMNIIKEVEKCVGKQGEDSQELQPAAIKNMLQTLSGPGAMPGGPPGGGAPPSM